MKLNVKYLVCALLAALVAVGAYADGKRGKGKDGWQEKVKTEKIAFLTTELDLTVEEAQAFWPVYNAMEAEKKAAMESKFKALKALKTAISEGKDEKEISSLTKVYLEASAGIKDIDTKYLPEFQKVLPAEKVAKVYISDEKFRGQQINRLGKGKHEGAGPQEGDEVQEKRLHFKENLGTETHPGKGKKATGKRAAKDKLDQKAE